MSQGEKVMADIQDIRAALTKYGNRLNKVPRKPVWIIHRPDNTSYRLTYQLEPLGGWAISPIDAEASKILNIIDRTLNHQRSKARQEKSSVIQQTNYQQQLHPWCIIQLLPQMQRRTVARFRIRNDADAHLRVLKRLTPSAQYAIIFDLTLAKTGLGVGV